MQQGGFETPADSGGAVDIVGISQARDKVLSLKLDQVIFLIHGVDILLTRPRFHEIRH